MTFQGQHNDLPFAMGERRKPAIRSSSRTGQRWHLDLVAHAAGRGAEIRCERGSDQQAAIRQNGLSCAIASKPLETVCKSTATLAYQLFPGKIGGELLAAAVDQAKRLLCGMHDHAAIDNSLNMRVMETGDERKHAFNAGDFGYSEPPVGASEN